MFENCLQRALPCLCVCGILGFALVATAQDHRAFKPGQVWLDVAGNPINAHGGCVVFHRGLYYWYGEHKIEGLSEAEHADGGVRCYASKDLLNWHDMGMMIRLDRPENEDLTHECNSDRPKVVYNESTREFVMFFKLYLRGQGSRVAFIAVANSASPTGPFAYRHKFLGGNSPQGTGDFAMFKDDDGSLYHLTVRKPDKAFVIGKMRDDYLLPESDYRVCEGVTKHTEAQRFLSTTACTSCLRLVPLAGLQMRPGHSLQSLLTVRGRHTETRCRVLTHTMGWAPT